jgi:hypothetical protein
MSQTNVSALYMYDIAQNPDVNCTHTRQARGVPKRTAPIANDPVPHHCEKGRGCANRYS